jgi:carbamate kinase
MQFAAQGGVAIIAALEDAAAAVDGNAGTRIVPANAPATVGTTC